jgi:hypothetical protein
MQWGCVGDARQTTELLPYPRMPHFHLVAPRPSRRRTLWTLPGLALHTHAAVAAALLLLTLLTLSAPSSAQAQSEACQRGETHFNDTPAELMLFSCGQA